MNLKSWAMTFGVALLTIGFLGFVPALTPNNLLLGIFEVDALHNLVHLLSGGVAIVAAMTGANYARMYFQAFGMVYALITILGFLTGNALVTLIPINMADNLLHIAIAATALYLGFAITHREAKA